MDLSVERTQGQAKTTMDKRLHAPAIMVDNVGVGDKLAIGG